MAIFGFCLNKQITECYDPCTKCKYFRKVSESVYGKGIKEYMKKHFKEVIF